MEKTDTAAEYPNPAHVTPDASNTRENVCKQLSVTLFYPAVLGFFIYLLFEKLFSVFDDGLMEGFRTILSGLLTEFVLIKIVLILTTLVFYCCDFLNSLFAQRFKWPELLVDLLSMFGVVVIFKSIGIEKESWQNDPKINNILIVYLSFMLIYILRYLLTRRRYRLYQEPAMTVDEKARLYHLFLLEGLLAILFFIILLINTFLVSLIMIVGASFVYIYVTYKTTKGLRILNFWRFKLGQQQCVLEI